VASHAVRRTSRETTTVNEDERPGTARAILFFAGRLFGTLFSADGERRESRYFKSHKLTVEPDLTRPILATFFW